MVLYLQCGPPVLIEEREIEHPLNIGGIVLENNASWKHALQLLDELSLILVLSHRSSSLNLLLPRTGFAR